MIMHMARKNSEGTPSISNMLRHGSRSIMWPISPDTFAPLMLSCQASRPVFTIKAATIPTQMAN